MCQVNIASRLFHERCADRRSAVQSELDEVRKKRLTKSWIQTRAQDLLSLAPGEKRFETVPLDRWHYQQKAQLEESKKRTIDAKLKLHSYKENYGVATSLESWKVNLKVQTEKYRRLRKDANTHMHRTKKIGDGQQAADSEPSLEKWKAKLKAQTEAFRRNQINAKKHMYNNGEINDVQQAADSDDRADHSPANNDDNRRKSTGSYCANFSLSGWQAQQKHIQKQDRRRRSDAVLDLRKIKSNMDVIASDAVPAKKIPKKKGCEVLFSIPQQLQPTVTTSKTSGLVKYVVTQCNSQTENDLDTTPLKPAAAAFKHTDDEALSVSNTELTIIDSGDESWSEVHEPVFNPCANPQEPSDWYDVPVVKPEMEPTEGKPFKTIPSEVIVCSNDEVETEKVSTEGIQIVTDSLEVTVCSNDQVETEPETSCCDDRCNDENDKLVSFLREMNFMDASTGIQQDTTEHLDLVELDDSRETKTVFDYFFPWLCSV